MREIKTGIKERVLKDIKLAREIASVQGSQCGLSVSLGGIVAAIQRQRIIERLDAVTASVDSVDDSVGKIDR